MKFKSIIFLLLVAIISCSKEEVEVTTNYFLSQEDTFTIHSEDGKTTEELPVALSKIKQILGSDIQPVTFRMINTDSEIQPELFFFYKESKVGDIKFVIFDVLSNDVLKKLYEQETAIKGLEDFSLQYTSLLFEDDSCILIEGKGDEERRYLYILNNVDNGKEFKLIGSFSATYSIFFDMNEKEDDNGSKFYILKDIALIDSALSFTNTTVQKKNVYVWDYEKARFTLAESSQIVSQENSDIPMSVRYSSENYFNFIKGFWYLSSYEKLIQHGDFTTSTIKKDGMQYVSFVEEDGVRQVNLNYGNYSDNFVVERMIKLGGSKPGMRLMIKRDSTSRMLYYYYIDLYLMEGKTIRVKSPEVYETVTYVRLDKPLIEYVQEQAIKETASVSSDLEKMLTGSFSFDGGGIEIGEDKKFILSSGQSVESGYYQIDRRDDSYIVSFFFDNENNIWNHKYFLAENAGGSRVVLLPVELRFSGITIKDAKAIVLEKGVENESKG